MNIYDYLKNNIDLNRIKEFKDDEYELAVIRYILYITAKLFYRDRIFFLNDENIKERRKIYQKRINSNNITYFNIVCSSYCVLLQEVLKNTYNISVELIETDRDVFKHIALLLITKNNNKYFIDPLMDLAEMKFKMKTHNFATIEQQDNIYMRVRIEGLSFLNAEKLKLIDQKIGYIEDGKYKDEIFSILQLIPNSEERIIKIFELRKYDENITGIVDLIICIRAALDIVLDKDEKKQVKIFDFFTDDKILTDECLKTILSYSDDRKRGVMLEYHNIFIIFSTKTTDYLVLHKKKWENIKKNNHIFVRTSEFVELYKYLLGLELEPNILDHREFLKNLSKMEKQIIADGENPQHYVHLINRGKVLIEYKNNSLEFSIENDLLTLFNKQTHKKFAIIYGDEGRKIEYKQIN